jgi:undecaprenyl-diphosphatase
MEPVLIIKALILGVVEGITEFLPVSSTGHLILAGALLDFNDERGKIFEIVIQSGAMAAVLWEYRARFFGALAGLPGNREARRFWLRLAVAFMPAAAIGLAFGSAIKAHLFGPIPVAFAFIAGGVVILWVERRAPRAPRVTAVEEMTLLDAFKIGLAQCFAMIPGVSRSGATIIGGMLFGLSRPAATEFSFFLAVPTLVAAGGYDLVRNRALLQGSDFGLIAIGAAAAFVSAFAVIRWLIRYVASHDFQPFAWYRIAFGLLILVTAWSGVVNWGA